MSTGLTLSEVDSDRFGYRIHRMRTSELDTRATEAALRASDCDIAIIRVPASTAGMDRLRYPVLHADTLVYYVVDLTKHRPVDVRNGHLEFRPATEADRPRLGALIASTFAGYTSHYHANPHLPPDKILAGYEEWAGGFLDDPDQEVSLVLDGDEVVAFAAWELRGEEAEGVLYGVSPTSSGGGLYGDLIRHTQREALEAGATRMLVSTQVQNFAVQKVWAREGFHMFQAWDTYHVMPWQSSGDVAFDEDVTFSADRVRGYAHDTGDDNPIHVSRDAAREAGFDDCITHGTLVLGEISRVLGTVSPGPGTIIASLQADYFRPVLVDAPHRLHITVVPAPGRRSRGTAVVSLTTPEGKLAVSARVDLVLPS